MKKNEVRVGKTIFISSNGWVQKEKITRIYVHEGNFGVLKGCLFAETLHFNRFAGKDIEGMFSLRDANIVPNTYNDHKAFFTPAAAYKHAANSCYHQTSSRLDEL